MTRDPFVEFLQENPPVEFGGGFRNVVLHWSDKKPPKLNHVDFGKPSSQRIKQRPLTVKSVYEHSDTSATLVNKKITLQKTKFFRTSFGYQCKLEVHRLTTRVAKNLADTITGEVDFKKPKDGWYRLKGEYWRDTKSGYEILSCDEYFRMMERKAQTNPDGSYNPCFRMEPKYKGINSAYAQLWVTFESNQQAEQFSWLCRKYHRIPRQSLKKGNKCNRRFVADSEKNTAILKVQMNLAQWRRVGVKTLEDLARFFFEEKEKWDSKIPFYGLFIDANVIQFAWFDWDELCRSAARKELYIPSNTHFENWTAPEKEVYSKYKQLSENWLSENNPDDLQSAYGFWKQYLDGKKDSGWKHMVRLPDLLDKYSVAQKNC